VWRSTSGDLRLLAQPRAVRESSAAPNPGPPNQPASLWVPWPMNTPPMRARAAVPVATGLRQVSTLLAKGARGVDKKRGRIDTDERDCG
jgi:hypothetical protein